MKDFLGKEFQVGQRIVYPGRASSSLWMNTGTIVAITAKNLKVKRIALDWDNVPTGETKQVTVYCTDRVVIVE